jgi:hypothetical protein
MSSFESTLRPRVFHFEHPDCQPTCASASPAHPSGKDSIQEETLDNICESFIEVPWQLTGRQALPSERRKHAAQRPTKLSKARELASKCKLHQYKDKTHNKPWVVANWVERVCTPCFDC